jgi:hypothetical protein
MSIRKIIKRNFIVRIIENSLQGFLQKIERTDVIDYCI